MRSRLSIVLALVFLSIFFAYCIGQSVSKSLWPFSALFSVGLAVALGAVFVLVVRQAKQKRIKEREISA